MSISIVVADDHQVVRDGISALLTEERDFDVVAEAQNGLEAIRVVEELKPDILVVDVMMPGLNGLEVIRQIRRTSPDTRVVVLSMYSNEEFVLEALRSGALGYVLKQSPSAELIEAVRAAAGNTHFLSPSLSERAIQAYLSRTESMPADPYYSLTGRERQVFQLSAEGLTSKEIGDRLSISPRTVEVHRARIKSKLGIHTYADLVKYAIRLNILPQDQALMDTLDEKA